MSWIDEIRTAHILLTRKCNLRCEYCGIVRNIPPFLTKNLSLSFWERVVNHLFNLNPNVFPIFYGGEPLLSFDGKFSTFLKFVKFLNSTKNHYAIHSNSTLLSEEKIKNLAKVGLRNWTVSCDFTKNISGSIKKKEMAGLWALEKFSKVSKNIELYLVITLTKYNIDNIEGAVESFGKRFWFEITLLDWKRNRFYDFSSFENVTNLIPKISKVKVLGRKLIRFKKEGFLIHNTDLWLKSMYKYVDSGFICKKPYYSLTIDSDGKLRLCYRIRGVRLPNFSIFDLPEKEKEILKAYKEDLKMCCLGCNWDCQFESEFAGQKVDWFSKLGGDRN
ncbi:MAG: radical SAM protein [Candidatus Aenigmatarchaeota archaeon]